MTLEDFGNSAACVPENTREGCGGQERRKIR